MSVTLNPAVQLSFQRPLTVLVKKILTVTNNSTDTAVAFKVKTTAPKLYCVRPNSGRIGPGESVEVSVLLQPMKEDPPLGTKCKDKFLVQSVLITHDREMKATAEIWSEVEKSDKLVAKDQAEIHEQKIRCVYTAANSSLQPVVPITSAALSAHSSTLSGTTAQDDDEQRYKTDYEGDGGEDSPTHSHHNTTIDNEASFTSIAYSMPSSIGASAPQTTTAPSTPAKKETRPIQETKTVTNPVVVTPPLPIPVLKAVPTPVKIVAATPSLSLADQLAASKREIASLKAQLAAATDLRSRHNATPSIAPTTGGFPKSSSSEQSGEMFATMTHKEHENAVPMNVVLGLVAGTFVLTWLFF